MTKLTESEYDVVCGNIVKKLMFMKITHPHQASVCVMYFLVWSCEAIQQDSKTKTVTTNTDSIKTKTSTLKTKTVEVLPQHCLETRQCLETSDHYYLVP